MTIAGSRVLSGAKSPFSSSASGDVSEPHRPHTVTNVNESRYAQMVVMDTSAADSVQLGYED